MSDKRVVVDPYAGIKHNEFNIPYWRLAGILEDEADIDVKTIKTVSIDENGIHIEYVPEVSNEK